MGEFEMLPSTSHYLNQSKSNSILNTIIDKDIKIQICNKILSKITQ